MEDEITIHEARMVLKRLVNERKSLEKALAAAELLSDIEINIANKQQVLKGITEMCADKEQRLIEIDENVSEIHERRDKACVEREQLADAKVQAQQALLEDLKDQYASFKADWETEREAITVARQRQIDAHKQTIDVLQSQIDALQVKLEDLQSTARRLAGV